MATPFDEEEDSGMEVSTPSEENSKTALIPTGFFEGKELKPGTTCKVKVERVLEGQVEVSYVPHTGEATDIEEDEEADTEMSDYMG